MAMGNHSTEPRELQMSQVHLEARGEAVSSFSFP
jgi:hypothetical protein